MSQGSTLRGPDEYPWIQQNSSYMLIGIVQPSSLSELIEQDGNTTYALGIFYIVAGIYAARRFLFLWSSSSTSSSTSSTASSSSSSTVPSLLPDYGDDGTVPTTTLASSIMNHHGILQSKRWDTGKLFVGSIFFNCLVRSLSFITLAILAFENVTIDSSNADTNTGRTQEQEFYHRVLAILFNVGDWAAISTYLLLVVVWVELLQTTRSHFFRQAKIRRDWMIAYIVLNSILYLVQTGLYLSVLLSPNNPDQLLNSIYDVIAFLNIAIPSVWLLTWASYFCQYAGFPFRSRGAKESWQRVTRLVTGWTFGRLLWAIAAIFTANNVFEDAVANVGNWLFTVVVVVLFVIAELIPLLASLGTSILQVISRAEEGGIDIDNNNGNSLFDIDDMDDDEHEHEHSSFSEHTHQLLPTESSTSSSSLISFPSSRAYLPVKKGDSIVSTISTDNNDEIRRSNIPVSSSSRLQSSTSQVSQENSINNLSTSSNKSSSTPNSRNLIINGRGETVSPILRSSSSVQFDQSIINDPSSNVQSNLDTSVVSETNVSINSSSNKTPKRVGWIDTVPVE